MYRIIQTTLVIGFLLITSMASAQCVAEITGIFQDVDRGSIVVEVEYTLNGEVVQTGRTRYLETSGSLAEIRAMAIADVREHCGNLIMRLPVHIDWIKSKLLERQKELTEPLIVDLQDYVGQTLQETEKVVDYKGKRVTLNADGTHSVTDIP